MDQRSRLFVTVLMLTAVLCIPATAPARVLFTGDESDFFMAVTPTATVSVDDWLNQPNLWNITIMNSGDGKTIKSAIIHINITSSNYGEVLSGDLTVVGIRRAYMQQLLPGQSFTVNNTMITEDSQEMSGGSFDPAFEDEVLRIGFMPEGTYRLRFTLTGFYDDNTQRFEYDENAPDPIDKEIVIRNPLPPELISPPDTDDKVVTVPKFLWEASTVSDFSAITSQQIDVYYTITLWKLFEDDGTVLNEEDAITRVHIWQEQIYAATTKDFDPGTAREELRSGGKYCWQVQALDGSGRPISMNNEGKSDVFDFTVDFSPPEIIEPLAFNPLSFRWTPAQAGGGVVQYNISIADNAEYAGAYEEEGLVMTDFRHQSDLYPLMRSTIYYIRLQTTDDRGRPIGEPDEISFTLPPAEVELQSPEDNTEIATSAPTFTWTSNATFNVVTVTLVTVSEAESVREYLSEPLDVNRWTYDADELEPGRTYEWYVTPTTDNGDPVGDPTPPRTFTLPPAGQVALVSPVGVTIESLLPTFIWDAIEPTAGSGAVTYRLAIQDGSGQDIHTTTTGETTYTYPASATELDYATSYSWQITAERNGVEIADPSRIATFTTPFGGEQTAEMATMEEISRRITQLISQYPQYASFGDMVLESMADETGPLTPSAFLELFDNYNLYDVVSE